MTNIEKGKGGLSAIKMNIWVPWFKLFNDIFDFAELCGIGTTSYFGKYFCSSSLFSPLTRSSKQNRSNCNAFLF